MSHHVFISYSRENGTDMRRVRDTLRAAGLDVWTDEGISPGTPSWRDAVQAAIEQTGCVVALLSPPAKASRWVKNELDYADIQGRRIFPVLVDGDERSALPFSLASAHYADIRADFDKPMEQLIDAINELLGRYETVLPEPSLEDLLGYARSESDKIRILIVDDIPETRENLKKLLAFEPDFEVVGFAGNGREGISVTRELQPDIVLMDINMPDMDGITATGHITREMPRTGVIMVSVQSDAKYMRESMLAGARDFLAKPVDMDELYGTIRAVHRAR